METGLRLLMRDGATHVAFQPKLSADQYIELLERVGEARTVDELHASMRELAEKWGSQVEFDSDVTIPDFSP